MDGKEEFYSGEKALKKVVKDLKSPKDIVENLSGVAASVGKAVGKAKVCMGVSDAKRKMEEGDILITGMTTPDFVPYMKIAAAIVANEGGATSHAAIISRELGIPCIVGTKIATKVIKDDDLVEVDADNNIVRVLEDE
jgi:pyruvate,water dikinase